MQHPQGMEQVQRMSGHISCSKCGTSWDPVGTEAWRRGEGEYECPNCGAVYVQAKGRGLVPRKARHLRHLRLRHDQEEAAMNENNAELNRCPSCNSPRPVKVGKRKLLTGWTQMWECRSCKHSFSLRRFPRSKLSESGIDFILQAAEQGVSSRHIRDEYSKRFRGKISHVAVIKIVHRFRPGLVLERGTPTIAVCANCSNTGRLVDSSIIEPVYSAIYKIGLSRLERETR